MQQTLDAKVLGRYAKVTILDNQGNEEVTVAKVDTGAYTSSIHAENLVVKGDKLSFYFGNLKFETKDFHLREVKSSNGEIQSRYVTKIKAIINGNEYSFKVSLANRSMMNYEMLLGHRFLKDNSFIVDVNKTNIN